jgi:hypothetical protein
LDRRLGRLLRDSKFWGCLECLGVGAGLEGGTRCPAGRTGYRVMDSAPSRPRALGARLDGSLKEWLVALCLCFSFGMLEQKVDRKRLRGGV